jgi:hypothetical protein
VWGLFILHSILSCFEINLKGYFSSNNSFFSQFLSKSVVLVFIAVGLLLASIAHFYQPFLSRAYLSGPTLSVPENQANAKDII